MAMYVTIHRAPGLTREEFQKNGKTVLEGKYAKFLQSFVNLAEGFITTVYEAESEDKLQQEFERVGFPFDEIHEVQFNMTHERLAQSVAAHAPK